MTSELCPIRTASAVGAFEERFVITPEATSRARRDGPPNASLTERSRPMQGVLVVIDPERVEFPRGGSRLRWDQATVPL